MKIKSSGLPADILSSSYPKGNYHILYFGEILATYADKEAKKNIP
jgi:hypothetical protein